MVHDVASLASLSVDALEPTCMLELFLASLCLVFTSGCRVHTFGCRHFIGGRQSLIPHLVFSHFPTSTCLPLPLSHL